MRTVNTEKTDGGAFSELDEAIELIARSGCRSESPERIAAMNIVQNAIDRVAPADYKAFYLPGTDLSGEQRQAAYMQNPLFYFYDKTFEKALAEIKIQSVPPGGAALWHIYNMGFVVKTEKNCFGIDLHHRLGEKLVPYLDFLLITHNHDDHYTLRAADAMNAAGKKVYSNFFPCLGGYSKEPFREIRHDGLTIRCFESDHNGSLRKFVMPFEIVCGPEKNACVIFSGGDSCCADQLAPVSPHVDFFIVHPYVGLDVVRAQETVHPAVTLVCHLNELHHPKDKWRWTFRDGILAAEKIRACGRAAWIPMWGEKIVRFRPER